MIEIVRLSMLLFLFLFAFFGWEQFFGRWQVKRRFTPAVSACLYSFGFVTLIASVVIAGSPDFEITDPAKFLPTFKLLIGMWIAGFVGRFIFQREQQKRENKL